MSTEFTEQQINETVTLANNAFVTYRNISAIKRAEFLEKIADEIEAIGDTLLQTTNTETNLPIARLTGERGRTTGQLRLFAQLLKDGTWKNNILDEALPDRQPLPRPELRQTQVPLGVVVVFGASNFPLAFSTAGGDTAAALAAGCPVIYKAHSAHPKTSELVADAIGRAVKACGLPAGVFSMLSGISHNLGEVLVQHPFVKAVGFTGSFRGGKALYDLAVRRQEPIPVYAEMGSVNPAFFLPNAISTGGETLANNFAASITMGCGQFCTNPGIFVLIDNAESKTFVQQLSKALDSTTLHPMLTANMDAAYKKGVQHQQQLTGVDVLVKPADAETLHPSLVATTVQQVLKTPDYLEEVFGPASVAVFAKDEKEMQAFIENMPGQLTATIFATEAEYATAEVLAELLTYKAGRILMNGFPTGVEVCHAMVHGGPFPATTDSRSTSVGTTAIYRFTRPVCYQNFPTAVINKFV